MNFKILVSACAFHRQSIFLKMAVRKLDSKIIMRSLSLFESLWDGLNWIRQRILQVRINLEVNEENIYLGLIENGVKWGKTQRRNLGSKRNQLNRGEYSGLKSNRWAKWGFSEIWIGEAKTRLNQYLSNLLILGSFWKMSHGAKSSDITDFQVWRERLKK